MPHFALLDPSNRLLTWSTSDLSLYGGQPTVTLGMSDAAAPGGAFVSLPTASATSAKSADDANVGRTAIDLTSPSAPEILPEGSGTTAPTSFAGKAPAIAPVSAPAIATEPTPAVPGPVGSGSLAPISGAMPLTTTADETAVSGLGSIGAGALSTPILNLVGAAQTLTDLAALPLNSSFVAPVVDFAIAGALDLVTTAATDAATALDGTLATAGTLLDGTVDALPIPDIAATVGPALATVAAISPTLDDTAAAVTGAAAGTLAQAAETANVITDDASSAATSAVVAPVVDVVDTTLGGNDPAGGVATLVDMVEADDLFDLSQAGVTAPITEGGSILDALSADETPGALLGVAGDDADGLLGGDHHDDHDGGLLGGL